MIFTRNEVIRTHLVFSKKEISKFLFESLRVVSLLAEKFFFFKSPGTTKIPRSFKLFVYINVVQNNLNYASTSNMREVIKFYNLGSKRGKQVR